MRSRRVSALHDRFAALERFSKVELRGHHDVAVEIDVAPLAPAELLEPIAERAAGSPSHGRATLAERRRVLPARLDRDLAGAIDEADLAVLRTMRARPSTK